MTKDEAMKLALEALEAKGDAWIVLERKAITAIKEALAQPEQEPVAWKEDDEVQCPVCKDKGFPWPKCGHITYIERTPPQRTWVGLTRAECLQIEKDMMKYYDYQHECKTVCLPEFARAIEAKLKQKNGFEGGA